MPAATAARAPIRIKIKIQPRSKPTHFLTSFNSCGVYRGPLAGGQFDALAFIPCLLLVVGQFPGRYDLFADHQDPGFRLEGFLTKKRKLPRVPLGRRSMACECGTCDRPGRQGLKGEDDGSPQHHVDVSSA
jgi:hypothetical protein